MWLDGESEGLCVDTRGGSYAQILESGELLLGFQIGHGGGAIFDDAGGGNVRVASVKAVIDGYR